MLILAQSKFTNFSTSNTTEAIWLNKWNHLLPLRSYELTGFPFNLGNGSCLLRTTTLLLCAKYPFTRFLYISMDIIHSTYKKLQQISDEISHQEKLPIEREGEREYLVHIHVHLKPFQCFNNYFQLHLMSFGWVLLLLNDVTVRQAYTNHQLIFWLTLKLIRE